MSDYEPVCRVRIYKRWNNNMVGDVIVVPLSTGRSLVAQGFAEPLSPPAGVAVGESSPPPPQPQRQPAQMTRK
jgi:hypothetical protein